MKNIKKETIRCVNFDDSRVKMAAALSKRIYNKRYISLCKTKVNPLKIKCINSCMPHAFLFVNSCSSIIDVYVVFRGTSKKFSRIIHNITVDINRELTPFRLIKNGGMVHSGFYKEYNKIKTKVINKLNQVSKEHPPNTKFNIIFTGHSLGSSIACLAATHFVYNNIITSRKTFNGRIQDIYHYGFSTPLIGDYTFVNTYSNYVKNKKLIAINYVFPTDPIVRANFDNNNDTLKHYKKYTKIMFPNKIYKGLLYIYKTMPLSLYKKLKENKSRLIHHGMVEIIDILFSTQKNKKKLNEFYNYLTI